jgi:hypothetical protein
MHRHGHRPKPLPPVSILVPVLPVVKGRVLVGVSELARTRVWQVGSAVGSEAGAAGED